MSEKGQRGAEALRDATIWGNIVAVSVPRPRGGMAAEIDRDERNARPDQAPCEQCLLAPQVFSIALADCSRFLLDVESVLRLPAQHHLNCLPAVGPERRHRHRLRQLAA